MNTEEYRLSFTAEEIDEKLGKIDNLAEKSQIPSKLSELIDDKGYALKSEIPEIDLSDYALSSEIPTDYLTSIPENYVTEEKLDAKGYLTEHQSLEGLATHEYVDDALAEKQPVGDYVLRSEIPECSSGAIIDVVELPTENINKNAFYRLLSAKIIYNGDIIDEYIIHCVDSLPEVGELVTNAKQTSTTGYYSVADNEVYGYVDDMFGAVFGVPAGWYPLSVFAEASGLDFGGIITDINDDPCDDVTRVLLNRDLYTYDNEWSKMIYASEKDPKFDIQWDGVIGDRFALDMSALGYDAGTYFVKVSDEVLNVDDVIGGTYEYYWNSDDRTYIDEIYDYRIDTTTYTGAFAINDWIVVVYSADELASTVGLPTGYMTNGVYYLLVVDSCHLVRLKTAPKVGKIDGRYLDITVDNTDLHYVAFTGNYYSLSNTPTVYTDVVRYGTTQSLSSTYKARARANIDVYSKSEVDAKIGSGVDLTNYATKEYVENLIGSAIGGSY